MRQVPRRAVLLGPVLKGAKLRQVLSKLKLGPEDLLIGVDGGTERWLELGIKPSLALGDWDSLAKKSSLRGLRTVSFPRDKTQSDLALAIEAAAEFKSRDLAAVGFTGGRPDHHLASLLELMGGASSSKVPFESVMAVGPEAEYHFLSKRIPHWLGELERGQLVSVFALKGVARGVTIRGMEYPLLDAILEPSSLGLSNRARHPRCEVMLRSGELLVVVPSRGRDER